MKYINMINEIHKYDNNNSIKIYNYNGIRSLIMV